MISLISIFSHDILLRTNNDIIGSETDNASKGIGPSGGKCTAYKVILADITFVLFFFCSHEWCFLCMAWIGTQHLKYPVIHTTTCGVLVK